jgi:preprotein translocase subunit SecE
MFKKMGTFFDEVRGELKRVSWPKRDELSRSTSVVIIMILATAIIIGLLDFIFRAVVLKFLGV